MKKILLCSIIAAFLTTSGLLYAQKTKKSLKKQHPIVIKTGIGTAKPPDIGNKKVKPAKNKKEASKTAVAEKTGVPEDVVSFKTNFEKDVKCRAIPLNTKVNIDFEDAPLYDVLKFVACLTQRNFIIGGKGASIKRGKNITILSTKPVTVYEAYKAFLSALHVNGMTVIPKGAFWEVVGMGKNKQIYPLIKGKIPDEDRIITHIIQPTHVDAADLDKVLNNFKSQVGEILVYEPTNTLIITDLASNVRRLSDFVSQLDVPTGKQKIWVRPVQYADAGDLVKTIQQMFGKKAKGRRGRIIRRNIRHGHAGSNTVVSGDNGLTTIMSDDRTNQLIVVATPAMYLKIDKLLRKLDVPVEGEGQIHVYYLDNADAEDVSNALTGLTGRHTSRRGRKRGKHKSSSAASLFEGEVKITAYKPTNSLIIESSLKDFLSVKKVIERLDIRRKQVYVEAMILEISSNKSNNLGLAGSGGKVFNLGGHDVPFLMGMGGLGMSSMDMGQLQKGGVALGMQGPLLDVSTGSGSTSATSTLSIPTYGFILQALAHNSKVNVLSTPHILTMDNQEAEIVVGKQIPYQASSYGGMGSLLSGLGGLGGLGTSATSALGSSGLASTAALSALGGYGGYGGGMGYVQRLDVDLSLKITPQISGSNYVRLKIDEDVQDVESMDATLGPTTSKRKVTNTVLVKDQQPVVIGGLIRDVTTKGVDKVPILGDIPILGMLFRKTITTKEKRNLMMVIIPYIINDPSDLRRIYNKKQKEMKEFAKYMSTKEKFYSTGLDYRKKTGLMEKINKAVEKVKEDEKLQDETKARDVDMVGPPETHELDYNPLKKEEK